MDSTTKGPVRNSIDRRVLNEFASKILNEERLSAMSDISDRGKRLSEFATMLFHCECDDKKCDQYIAMSTEEYTKMHTKTKQFVVVNAHVRIDIEKVVEHFNSYSLVEKFFPGTKEKPI
jgi:hypothetical protein